MSLFGFWPAASGSSLTRGLARGHGCGQSDQATQGGGAELDRVQPIGGVRLQVELNRVQAYHEEPKERSESIDSP